MAEKYYTFVISKKGESPDIVAEYSVFAKNQGEAEHEFNKYGIGNLYPICAHGGEAEFDFRLAMVSV